MARIDRDAKDAAAQHDVADTKPVLRKLCDDLRAAAESAGGDRKERLEIQQAALHVSLMNPKHADVTEEQADEFRKHALELEPR